MKVKKHKINFQRLFSQVLAENEYLRYTNEKVIGNLNQETKDTNYTNESNNCLTKEDNKKANQYKKSLHKRQKTHFNINQIQHYQQINSDLEYSNTVESNNSSSTIIDTSQVFIVIKYQEKVKDLFNLSLNNLSLSKTIKKDRSEDSNLLSPQSSSNPTSNIKNQKSVFLFYRTPSNKDNKKIEFCK